MEKILGIKGLGVSGRQNELIELALTFKFNTVEVDMNDLIGRFDTMGNEFACQFLKSAKINIGTFELPIDLDADDEKYAAACKKLDTIFSLCETLHGTRCRVPIATSSEEAFQQNFERHRTRLHDLGDECQAHGLQLGLALQLPSSIPKPHKFIHTADEIVTLMKTVGHPQVGLCLDTWHWRASGGSLDQISELDVNQVTELAMADLPVDFNPAKITVRDRVMPGDAEDSFSLKVFETLKSAGYNGAISFATHLVTFANVSRDLICNRMSKRLDCVIAGQPFDAIVEKPLSVAAAVEDEAAVDIEIGDFEDITEVAAEEITSTE